MIPTKTDFPLNVLRISGVFLDPTSKIGFICHFNGQSLKEIGTCRWLHGQWGREVDLALGSWKKQTHYPWGDNFPQGYLENLYEEKIAKPMNLPKKLQRIAW